MPNAVSPRDLPIHALADEIVARLQTGTRLILQAPTGSGKSTQVPQMLLDAGLLGEHRRVVVLQPRRLAARMLATRVARERGVHLGREVGYTIRFDNQSGRDTRIQFVTEGILLRQMLGDPELRSIGAILFDEFHERHLYGDLTLARALDLQESARPDLRLVVMSATLDTGLLARHLGPEAAVLTSAGRTFPVDVDYLPMRLAGKKPAWEMAADELERLGPEIPVGDALVFMPGAYEISRTIQEIRSRRTLDRSWIARPLHGELPPAEQDAALAPSTEHGRRKVVVATNVAETSLTIEGVRIVIDSGLARIARFDPFRGINTLLIEKISRASAEQRAGRAGRTAPGFCMRLWPQDDHLHRAAQETPEIKRLDLAEVVLTLKAAGVADVRAFRWLEAPEARALERAERLLESLGATEPGPAGAITPLGRRMLAFPVHPRYARLLLEADAHGDVADAARIAALTQGKSLLVRPIDSYTEDQRENALGREKDSDFLLLLRALRFAEANDFDPGRLRHVGIHAQNSRTAAELATQFLRLAREQGLSVAEGKTDPAALRRCILAAFSDQLARRLDTGTLRCALVGGRRGVLARETAPQDAPLLVAAEVREVEGRDRELNTLLTLATAVEESWLRELFPRDFSDEETVEWDAAQKRVLGRRRRKFRDLVIAEKMSEDPPREAAAALLAREIHAGRLRLEGLEDGVVEQWTARLNSLEKWMPELELPPLGEDDRLALLEQLCLGAWTWNQVRDRSEAGVFRSWLSSAQQGWLDEHAPERLELPGGRARKLRYTPDGAPPVLAARIQELYGVEAGLFVAARRVPVTIEILAPNQRPIQVTRDLANFWREQYPKVKAELQRRYPRHEWR